MSTAAVHSKAEPAARDGGMQTGLLEVSADDGDLSPRKATTRKRKSVASTTTSTSAAASTPASLPLILSKPGALSTTLLAIRDPTLSLANDTGIIGRLILPTQPTSNHSHTVTVDLKGRLYSGQYRPTASLLLVTQRQSEARVDAVLDAVCAMVESDAERVERQRRETEDGAGGGDGSDDELDADVNRSEREEQRDKKRRDKDKVRKKKDAGKASSGSTKKASTKKRKPTSSTKAGGSKPASATKKSKTSGGSRSKKK